MFITIVLIPIFKGLAVRVNVMDVPNKRKVHSCPMPKSGGIAMALGALVPIFFWVPATEFVRAVLIGAGIVVLFGLIDDVRNLRWKTKLAGQCAAALVVILYGGVKIKSLGILLPYDVLMPDWFAIPFTLIAIVGVTNAINLSDGLDGLAGGISLLIFICIGCLAYCGDNIVIALLSVAIVGAILGFLRFNTYPAVLFMGDAGSQLLGFLSVTFSLALTQGNTSFTPLLPLILLGFPVLDTLTVMYERLAGGRSLFVADKNHFHHKLIRLGLYHTEAVLVIYIFQAFLVTFAFVFRFYSEWFFLIFYMIFSACILSGFFVAKKSGWKFKRYDFVDKIIKGRLRILKEKNILIKVSSRLVEVGVPSLLLFTCFLPASMPIYFSFFSMALLVLLLVTLCIKKEWMGTVLRLILYPLIPIVIYWGETDMVAWMNDKLVVPYNLFFGFLFLFVILTLKFTRRRNGFKSTPMDFLILFIALAVPNFPDEQIQSYHMGLMAAKIIVFFFSYEVLIGELRVKLNRLVLTTILALMIISVKAML
ncbi:MAG: undecaprenyl/decaprenyl-phosphate alpha-N-acetylglucosaminyl 1-phosphate transferase [Deltaproteobacteria bacterium]|nr:undecaprenyl/decaprenyl-phosphate alpha-N-acetylglucosaminyl 1-phosphate transferase [Deltaproteobacteria bacterium]